MYLFSPIFFLFSSSFNRAVVVVEMYREICPTNVEYWFNLVIIKPFEDYGSHKVSLCPESVNTAGLSKDSIIALISLVHYY